MPNHPLRSRSSLALLVSFASFTACAAPPVDATPGQIEHVVLIWLQDPGNRMVRDRIAATARTFPEQIPGIVSMSIGDPLPSDRDIVDDSFDLALVMRFASAQALADYTVHPVHEKAVATVLTPHLRRLQVYDVVVR